MIPLELLTTLRSSAKSFSPVIWDGEDLVVPPSSQTNLRKIHSDLRSASLSQSQNSTELERLKSEVLKLRGSIARVEVLRNQSEAKLRELSQSASGSEHSLNLLLARLDKLSADLNANLLKFEKAEAALTKLFDGSLIKGSNGVDLAFSGGKYLLTDNAQVSVGLIGDNSAQVRVGLISGNNTKVVLDDDGNFTVNANLPKLVDIIREGRGVRITEEGNGLLLDVLPNLFNAGGGLRTRRVNGSQQVYAAADFIVGDVSRGVEVKPTGNGRFSIGIRDEVLANLGSTYLPGYAVSATKVGKNGMNLTLKPKDFPVPVGGGGIKVEKKGIDYHLSFTGVQDQAKPPSKLIEGQFPIGVQMDDESGDILVSDSLEVGSLSDRLVRAMAQEQKAVELSQGQLNLGVSNFRPTELPYLVAPISKLYELVVGNFTDSGLMAEASLFDKSMLSLFGFGKHRIDLRQNVMPQFTVGVNGEMLVGVEQEVDLYLPIQQHLRKLLGNPSLLLDSYAKSKISILEVGSTVSDLKFDAELESLHYNTRIKLIELGEKCGAFDGLTLSAGDEAVLQEYSLSGGDCDFIMGNARAGQRNSKPLVFPKAMSKKVKIKLNRYNIVEASPMRYEMEIEDGYSGKTYNSEFAFNFNKGSNADNVVEVNGQGNPDWVRAAARLLASNIGMSDAELNIVLYWVAFKNKCLPKYGADIIFSDALRGGNSVEYGRDYIKDLVDLLDSELIVTITDIDKETGKAKFKVGHPIDDSIQLTANQLVSAVVLPLSYSINVDMQDFFSEAELFRQGCCNPFNKVRDVTCDENPSYNPEPEVTTTTTELPTTTSLQTTEAPPINTGLYVDEGYVEDDYFEDKNGN